jgi:glycine/D-amino acid oxidase-like deaminating enzyme
VDGIPVWESSVGQDDVRALNPGPPDPIPLRPDIVVVGGGSVGLATAVMCRRAGLGSVLLLERHRLASGPSGRAAGILAPEPHAGSDPAFFVDFGWQSLRLTRELDDELGGALGLHNFDCLLVGVGLEEAALSRHASVELLDADGIGHVEPVVAGVTSAVLIRGQSRVHPLRFAAALARHGDVTATGVEAGESRRHGERIVALETSYGTIHPGAVVFATGTAPTPFVTVGHDLIKGHLLATEPVPFRLNTQVVTPMGGALQLDDGRLLSGGTLDEGDTSPSVRPEIIEAIRRGLARVIPETASTPSSHTWCCFRPATPDRLPIIDRVPEVANAWFSSGHYRTGLLMAVGTADALSRWILDGTRPAEVDGFGLSRFNGAQAPPADAAAYRLDGANSRPTPAL